VIPLVNTLLMIASTTLGSGDSTGTCCGKPLLAKALSVGNSARGHLIAIRDDLGRLKTIEWDSTKRAWSTWDTMPAQSGIYSDPWVQAAEGWSSHGLVNNVFALNRSETNSIRTSQWIRTPAGSETTIGIGESDSIWFRPASARLGEKGSQALFAVFRDSTLRMRVWDSVSREWSGWKEMGMKTGFPPTATQVDSQNVNVYVTVADGSIRQNWWRTNVWNGWVVPSYGGAASEPSSVNTNWYDHLLFSFSPGGVPQFQYWNGGSWTSWAKLNFPAKRDLSPVVAGTDSVLLYGIDSADQIVRIGWKKAHGWGLAETLGLCPRPPVFRDNRTLAATATPEGLLLAVRGWNDSLYTLSLNSPTSTCRHWSLLQGQPKTTSNPWLQPRVGPYNNLFVVGEVDSQPRIFQWMYSKGEFLPTSGIGEADSATSLASGRLDTSGRQVLFATFKDQSIRMRIWDSLDRTWGGWTDLHQTSARSLGVSQIDPANLQLLAVDPEGSVHQREWNLSAWSPWETPRVDPIASAASSANFDANTQVLFGMNTDGRLTENVRNGTTWTGWRALPWIPLSEPVPVVENEILNLFFINADSNVVLLRRLEETPWGEPHILGKVPPSSSCVYDTILPIRATSSLTVRSGVLRTTGSLAAFGGTMTLIRPDGRIERLQKQAGSKEFQVPLQGVGFLRYGTETTRLIGIR